MKVTVDVDFVEGDIEEHIVDQVARKLALVWHEQLQKRIAERANELVDAQLTEAINAAMTAEFQPLDEWGDPKGNATCLRELVKGRAHSFMSEKVDKDGKRTTYQAVGTRMEWLARKVAEESLNFEVKQELVKAAKEAKSQMAKGISDVLAKTLTGK